MQKTLIILLCLISCQVFGQRDIKVNVDDFNKGGVIDTLKSFYQGGRGFGGKYVQIINGKTHEIYELSNDGCFCQIKDIILIPPELNKTENRLFLETIKKQLLPEKRNAIDNEKRTFLINEESIILNVEGEQLSYSLKNIFKELETQYITK